MGRASHRETILTEGLRVLHQRGYMGASVRDISEAAGVPLGSFTNHFSSKEAFTLEVLNIYYSRSAETIRKTLLNDAVPPLRRIREFIDATDKALNQNDVWNGCLLGNLGIEASEHSEVIRNRVAAISRDLEKSIAYALEAAVKEGDLPQGIDCLELASFIVFSQHGAYLQSKVDRSSVPIDLFKKFLFSTVLR